MTTAIDRMLSKLEAKAAEVLRCDWCLVVVSSPALSYSTDGLNPAEVIPVTCRWCGWRVVYNSGGLDAPEVESLRIHLNAGPSDRFHDPRTFAADHWYPVRVSARKWVAAYQRLKEGLPLKRRRSAPARLPGAFVDKAQRKADEAKREREARLERGRAFARLMHAKERKSTARTPSRRLRR